IFDSHAVRFSRAFYTALANGYGIEAALGEGRKGIHGQAYSWGIPAFYLQGDEPFVLRELDIDERVNHLWQKAQQRNDLAGRRHLLAEILRLAPGHEAATAAQKALEQEARAEHLYAAARQYVQNEQWEDARRTLIQVDRIIHNYRDTLILLEEVIGKLPQELPPVPPAKLDHIDLILEALQRGRLTIFLGSDASSIGQPAARWEQGLYPPSAADAARALADEVALELTGERSMLQVSQYFELNRGVYDLYARLESLYNGDFEPTLLHHLLARLPTQLADRGLPNTTRWRYVIFTTAFDNLLEEAFAQAGQPYHLFAYRPPFVDEQDIPQPALFVHMPPTDDGEQGPPVEVRVPNQYRGHEDDNHPVIVKLCGWRVTADPDSVAVTEDQYVDYIAADRTMTVLPASLLRDLKPNSFLFFGHSLQPWHLRFLWKRLGLRVDERQPRKWAIVPALNDVEATFWQSQRIEPIVAQPEGVVAYVTNWLESL
ncbi:MAG: SIR2 family protein, partial [Caldilineaceae bacterium]|nr:SIR2 family protein [Caldilineaceae bacterium]